MMHSLTPTEISVVAPGTSDRQTPITEYAIEIYTAKELAAYETSESNENQQFEIDESTRKIIEQTKRIQEEVRRGFAYPGDARTMVARDLRGELSGLNRYIEAELNHKALLEIVKKQIFAKIDDLQKLSQGEKSPDQLTITETRELNLFSQYIKEGNRKGLEEALNSGSMDDLIRALPSGKRLVVYLDRSREQVEKLKEPYRRYFALAEKAISAISEDGATIEHPLHKLTDASSHVPNINSFHNLGLNTAPEFTAFQTSVFHGGNLPKWEGIPDYDQSEPNPNVRLPQVLCNTHDLPTCTLEKLAEVNQKAYESALGILLSDNLSQTNANTHYFKKYLREQKSTLGKEIHDRWGNNADAFPRTITANDRTWLLERSTPFPTAREVSARAEELLRKEPPDTITQEEAKTRVQGPLSSESILDAYADAQHIDRIQLEARFNDPAHLDTRDGVLDNAATTLFNSHPRINEIEARNRAEQILTQERTGNINAKVTRAVADNTPLTFREKLELARKDFLHQEKGIIVRLRETEPAITVDRVLDRQKRGTLEGATEDEQQVLLAYDIIFDMVDFSSGSNLFGKAQKMFDDNNHELGRELSQNDLDLQRRQEKLNEILREILTSGDDTELPKMLDRLGIAQNELSTTTKTYVETAKAVQHEVAGFMGKIHIEQRQRFNQYLGDLYHRLNQAGVEEGSKSKWWIPRQNLLALTPYALLVSGLLITLGGGVIGDIIAHELYPSKS